MSIYHFIFTNASPFVIGYAVRGSRGGRGRFGPRGGGLGFRDSSSDRGGRYNSSYNDSMSEIRRTGSCDDSSSNDRGPSRGSYNDSTTIDLGRGVYDSTIVDLGRGGNSGDSTDRGGRGSYGDFGGDRGGRGEYSDSGGDRGGRGSNADSMDRGGRGNYNESAGMERGRGRGWFGRGRGRFSYGGRSSPRDSSSRGDWGRSNESGGTNDDRDRDRDRDWSGSKKDWGGNNDDRDMDWGGSNDGRDRVNSSYALATQDSAQYSDRRSSPTATGERETDRDDTRGGVNTSSYASLGESWNQVDKDISRSRDYGNDTHSPSFRGPTPIDSEKRLLRSANYAGGGEHFPPSKKPTFSYASLGDIPPTFSTDSFGRIRQPSPPSRTSDVGNSDYYGSNVHSSRWRNNASPHSGAGAYHSLQMSSSHSDMDLHSAHERKHPRDNFAESYSDRQLHEDGAEMDSARYDEWSKEPSSFRSSPPVPRKKRLRVDSSLSYANDSATRGDEKFLIEPLQEPLKKESRWLQSERGEEKRVETRGWEPIKSVEDWKRPTWKETYPPDDDQQRVLLNSPAGAVSKADSAAQRVVVLDATESRVETSKSEPSVSQASSSEAPKDCSVGMATEASSKESPPPAPPSKAIVAWLRYMDALNTLDYTYVKYVIACKEHEEVQAAIAAVEELPIGREAYEQDMKSLPASPGDFTVEIK